MKAAHLLLAILALPLALFADEKVTIGNESLTIPLPEGFTRLDGANKEFDAGMLKLVPSTNRMLLTVALPGDVAKAKASQEFELNRYAMLQTFREGESMKLTLKQFEQIAETMEKQFSEGGLLSDAEAKTNQQLKNADLPDIKVGQMRMIGKMEKTDRSLDLGMLTKLQVGTEGPQTLVTGMSTVVVKGKVLYMYVYSSYKGKADADWTRSTVKTWREAVLAANPGGTEKGGVDWGSMGGKVLVGAIVGGLAGLVATFFRKRKANSAPPPPPIA